MEGCGGSRVPGEPDLGPLELVPRVDGWEPARAETYSASGKRVTKRSNPRNRLSVLVGIALVSGACSDSGDAPTEPVTRQPEAIELAVRVHLVQSDQLDALNVRLSETEVAQLMTAVNETWAPAGIVWSVESIVREDARNEFLFLCALTDPTVSPISEQRT